LQLVIRRHVNTKPPLLLAPHPNNSSSQHHHYPHFTNTTTPHPWMGGGVNMSSSASYHPHHTSTTSGGVPGAQLGHQQYQQSFIHNMPSTSMPLSSQQHQYNYPAVGPSIYMECQIMKLVERKWLHSNDV
jgi:hypothetical protein